MLCCVSSSIRSHLSAWQAVHLARRIGGITVRGNHDEMALERYEMWKKCGRLDVRSSFVFHPDYSCIEMCMNAACIYQKPLMALLTGSCYDGRRRCSVLHRRTVILS